MDSEKHFNLNFDLGRVAIFDSDPKIETYTEDDIVTKTKTNLKLLFTELYKLKSLQLGEDDENRDFDKPENVVTLPKVAIALPRAKPIPKSTKQLTKWEEFAKDKGINKKKKARMIWSDQLGKYLPRWGKDSIKTVEARAEAIIEDKPKYEGKNPFTVKKQEAKLKHFENKKREKGNEERFLNKKRERDTRLKDNVSQQRKKLEVAQKSTASVGRFDKQLKNEKPLNTIKRKKVDSEVYKSYTAEKQRDNKLLSRLLKDK